MDEGQKNSVKNLQNLYSVVVGVALSLAIVRVIDTELAPVPVRYESLVLLVAYVVTLVPFYHGALRHLDTTYVEQGGKHVRGGALMLDFAILFLEGCLFLGLAALVETPAFFAWGLLTLLVVDVVWGIVAHLAFTKQTTDKAELKWVQNNLAFALLLLLYLGALGVIPPDGRTTDWALTSGVLGIALARTFVDYYRSWQFYYPS